MFKEKSVARSKLARMKGLSSKQLDHIAGGRGMSAISARKSDEDAAAEAAVEAELDMDGTDDQGYDDGGGTDIGATGYVGVGLSGGVDADDDIDNDQDAAALHAAGQQMTAPGLGLGHAAQQTTQAAPAQAVARDAQYDSSEPEADDDDRFDAEDDLDLAEVPGGELTEPDEGQPQEPEKPSIPSALTNVFGDFDDELGGRVDHEVDRFVQNVLGHDFSADQAAAISDASQDIAEQFGDNVNTIIAAKLGEVLDADALSLLMGRPEADPEYGMMGEMNHQVMKALTEEMRSGSMDEILLNDHGQPASPEEIAANMEEFLQGKVITAVQHAVDGFGEEIEAVVTRYEEAEENRSDVADAAAGLAEYVSAVSVKENAFVGINDAFSQLLEGDSTAVAAVAASRAAATASHVIENALTDLMGIAGGDIRDASDVTIASEFLMDRVMTGFSEELKEGRFDEALGKIDRHWSEEEQVKFLSEAIETQVEEMAQRAVLEVQRDGTMDVLERGFDGVRAEMLRKQFEQWEGEASQLADPAAGNSSSVGFGKISLPEPVSVAEGGGSDGIKSMDLDLNSQVKSETGLSGSTGASASAGVDGLGAGASAGVFAGTSLTQKAGDWTQTLSVGAGATAMAYAGATAIGVGAAFMAGVELETDFGGGERLIQRVATEGSAAAALGYVDGTLGVQTAAGIKAYTLTRMETNTDIGPIGSLDANAGFESGLEASGTTAASIGQQNQLGYGASLGYNQTFSADGQINHDFGNVGGGMSYSAPGSVGTSMDFEVGFSDGTLSIDFSGSFDVLLGGLGLSFSTDINLFGSDHTRGSAEEINQALYELKDHILDFDTDMTRTKMVDMEVDAARAGNELEGIQHQIGNMVNEVAEFLENETELRPKYEKLVEEGEQEIASLSQEAEELHGRYAELIERMESLDRYDPQRQALERESDRVMRQGHEIENRIESRQEQLDEYTALLEGDTSEIETMKVFHELEKQYVEDLQSDAHALQTGAQTRQLGEKLSALQSTIDEYESLSDEDKARFEDDERSMQRYNDAKEAFPGLMEEYQQVAANSFMNQSSGLVAEVKQAEDAFVDQQFELVQSQFKAEAAQLLADNMDLVEKEGPRALLDQLEGQLADLKEQGHHVGDHPTDKMVIAQLFSEVKYGDGADLKAVVGEAQELEAPDMGDYVDGVEPESGAIPNWMIGDKTFDNVEEIRNNPGEAEYLALSSTIDSLRQLLDSMGDVTAEAAGEALTEARNEHEAQLARTLQADVDLDNSMDTLRAEHPLTQSQYKLDNCRENIASLTEYLERDDISESDRRTCEIQLGGYQKFLDLNEERLEEDAREMRTAYQENQRELERLKERHSYLSEIVHEDGLFGWMF
jgi:hypothetical protein